MRIRPLHFKVDLISSLILEKNVKNVDFPILIYSIAPKSGAIQYGGRSKTLSYTILLEEVLGEKKCRQKHGGFRPLLTPD